MNTKIIYSIAVLAVAALAAMNVSVNTRDNGLSDLSDVALDNIEALATGEGVGGSHTLSCGSSGIKMCKATCGIHQVTVEAWGNGSPATLTCNR
jgi:hypothetical protein